MIGLAAAGRVIPAPSPRRAAHLVERNLFVYRRAWLMILSGFFEPLFYLLGIGFGVGSLVGSVTAPSGHALPYAVFVAPAMMATSAMNGAVYDTTFNLFFNLNYAKIYDAILATPIGVADVAVGEVGWALVRGTLYATAFVIVMAALGLVTSPWGVLAVPAAVLIGFAFAAVGTAATTFMRSWQDFDLVNLVLLPLFLFSGTFFPVTLYPAPVQVFVQLTPLYHAANLIRGFTTGNLQPGLAIDSLYLLGIGVAAMLVAAFRLGRLLRK